MNGPNTRTLPDDALRRLEELLESPACVSLIATTLSIAAIRVGEVGADVDARPVRPVVDHQRRVDRRRRCPGSSATVSSGYVFEYGGGVEPIAVGARRDRVPAELGRLAAPCSDVQPITTVTRPATWSIAVSATRRRSSGVCENHSPVVPLMKMPCIPSPTYHSSERAERLEVELAVGA